MLQTRVREVYAIAKCRELSQTDAFANALEKSARAPLSKLIVAGNDKTGRLLVGVTASDEAIARRK